MKKLYSFFVVLLFASIGYAQTATIWASGAAGSFTTGHVLGTGTGSGTLTRNDNIMAVAQYRQPSTTMNMAKAWATFDLSGIPAGSTITSVSFGWYDSAIVGTYAGTTSYLIYGYSGELSKFTQAQNIYSSIDDSLATGSLNKLYSTRAATGFGTVGNNTANLNTAFFAANAGGKVSICFAMHSLTTSNSQIFYINGERGSTATITTANHAPYITVTYTAPGACSGTPTGGTATISPRAGNTNSSHVLSLTGATSAAGITYQWQSAPTDVGTWTNITGATNKNFTFTGVSATTFYRCNVTCGGTTVPSSVTSVSLLTTLSCAASYSVPYYGAYYAGATTYLGYATMWPMSITGGGGTTLVDSLIGNTLAYTDQTSVAQRSGLTFYKSNSYTINLRTGSMGTMNTQIWIDYNSNGTFESTEIAGGGNFTTAGNTEAVAISAIPTTATVGYVRMRIRASWGGSSYPSLAACGALSYGETRDYLVNITDPPPGATATPTALNFNTTVGPVTAGTTSTAISTSLNATYLLPSSGTLTVTAPANFSVCSTAGGTYVSSYTMAYTGATSSSTIFAKFSPSAAITYSDTVLVTGGGMATAFKIPINGTGAAVCSGTPSPGIASASPLSGNTIHTFTLTCSGYSSSGGLQFQWQSSADSSSWSNISGATTSIYTFTGISAATYYRCVVTCSASGSSANTFATLIRYFAPSSCTPNFASGSSNYTVGTTARPFRIVGASGTILDADAPSAGYVDKSAIMSCTLNTGATYAVTTGNNFGGPMSYQVWIDFSNDGVFQTSENVGGINLNTTVGNFNISIPVASALVRTGHYRMRVESEYYYHAYPTLLPCPNGSTTLSYNGEVRDYKVIINAVPTLTFTPSSLTFSPTVPTTSSSSLDVVVTAAALNSASGSLTITAPTNFQVFNGSAWVSSYTVGYSSFGLGTTTIPVRFSPSTTGTLSGNVTITGGGLSTVNIPVSGLGAAACSGTPTAGTGSASPSSGNTSTIFTLTCTGFTAAGGIQFQWQSSPDSTSWTNITGATLASYSFTGISTSTYYRCNVTCSASTTPTSAFLISYMTPSSCTPVFTYAPYYYTVGSPTNPFRLTGSTGSIVDNAAPSNGYVDYTGTYGCTLNTGATYTATMGSVGTTGYGIQAWIDFSNDGVFQSSETVGGIGSTTAVAQAFSIVIPTASATIRPGVYRMRVEAELNNHFYPNILPCPNASVTSSQQGEVRDYRITINALPTPIVAPSSITFPPTTVSTSSTPVNISLSALYLTPASGSLTVTAPTGYLVNNGASWVSSYTIGYTAGTLSTTSIPVQFNPIAVTTYSGNVTIAGGGLTTINVPVSGAGAAICTGTPTAGTAACSPTSGNSATSFTITCTGYTVSGGIQFQWEQSNDSSSWSSISGATLASYTFTGISSNKYYRCLVTCSASSLSAYANTNKVTFFPGSTCTPAWYSPGSNNTYSIGNATNGFKLNGASGSINNNAVANAVGLGYTDNTATMGCTLNAGTSYTCTTGSSTTGISYQAWLDYNSDGTFQSSETIGGIASSTSTIQTFTILVPTGTAGIAPGIYRMRVAGQSSTGSPAPYPNQTPCPNGSTPYYYGDVRDYKIVLNVPPYATVSPSSLTYSPTTIGTSSAPQTVTVSGNYLVPASGSLTITAPSGYAVSETGSSYASSYTVAYTGSTYTGTAYVQFNPTAATTYTGNVTLTGGGLTTTNIAVSGTGASACSGTPTAGTTASAPTSGNSGTSFTLSLTGASTLGGLAYQWQSAPSVGGTYTDITGATNATYTFSGLLTTTYYRCTVTCTGFGSPATSTPVAVTFALSTASCVTTTISQAAASCTSVNMKFINFSLSGSLSTSISDAATCNSTGYLDRTSLSCTLYKSYTYNATATTGSSNNCYTQVWIDFNSDGIFQSTESVGGTTTAFVNSSTFTITLPAAVPSGTFRMRACMSWSSNPQIYPNINPCMTSYSYGEGRDYTVTVINPGPTFSASPSSVDFGTVGATTTSSATLVNINGSFLTPTSGTVTITAPSNYQICSTVGGTYVSSYTISYTGTAFTLGTFTSIPVYVKFIAPATVGTYAGNISVTGGGLSAANVPVTAISAYPCTGAPTAGTVSLTPTSGISGSTFNMSLSGASAGLSIVYQWQSSISGVSGSFTNISGATNPTYSATSLSTSTYFQCVITCTNSGISSTTPPVYAVTYCLPTFATTSSCGMGVYVANPTNHFRLTGASGFIRDSGACGSYYTDNYATMGCTLNAGTTYSYITGGGGSIGYGVSEQIFIDFNSDGIFQTTETVGGIASYLATAVNPTGNITIPSGSIAIAPGTYRMRVVVILPGTPYPNINPCPSAAGGFNYGEVRDYRITLNVPPIGSVSPTSLAFPVTTTGTSSSGMSSTFTGLYLTPSSGTLTITAPSNFTVYDGSSWVSSYTTSYTSGLLTTSILARFNPISSVTSSGNITITGGGLSTVNLAVSGTGAAACTGTPSAGTATVAPGAGSSSTVFTLTTTGFTALGAISFQWQSTTDTTSGWTDISGATTSVYSFTGITSDMYYRCNVTCGTSSITTSTFAKAAVYLVPSSCTPTCNAPTTACSSVGIYLASNTNRLRLVGAGNTLLDSFACNNTGYRDNTATHTVTLSLGNSYTMTCGSGGFNTQAYQVWIDFNSDGAFQTSESVGGRTATTTSAATFTITIPSSGSVVTTGGPFRMRVVGDFSNNYPSIYPCPTTSNSTYAEARDYRVMLNTAPALTVAPTSLAFPPTTVTTASSPISAAITGAYLVPASGSITITAPTGFTVYNGASWVSSYTIGYAGSTLIGATIQTRFEPSAATSYTGNVTIAGGGTTINLAVSGTGAALCSGAPTAGTAAASVSLAGSTTPITLTNTGYTVSGGIQFQWQSSTDTTSGIWSNISGATLAAYNFTGISANSYFRCKVTCSASSLSDSTNIVLIRFMAASSCTPSFVYPGCTYGMVVATPSNPFRINGSSGSINDATVCSSSLHYRDFTSTMSVTLNAGASYSATCGNGGGNPVSYQIWIDFNNDGTFQTTESVGGNAGSTTASASMVCPITIPTSSAGVTPGLYRMRVVCFYYYNGTFPSIPPCPNGVSPSTYGEVRDYAVNINVPPTGSVSPTSLTFPATTISSVSSIQTVALTANYLLPTSGSLTITAPTGYTLFTGSSYVSSYTVGYTGGTLSHTISVRFEPTAASTYTGNVTIAGGGLTTINVPVTGTGSSGCTGTPTAGSVLCTPSYGTSGSTFAFSLVGSTVAGGLTYQWQSSTTAGGSYTPISGATGITYSVSGLSATTFYNCVVTCTSSGGTSTAAYDTANVRFPAASCTPAPSFPSCGYGMAMTSFTLTGSLSTSISDASACSGTGYQDRTSLSCTLYKSYTYNTTVGFSSGNACIAQFWIDFNSDSTFQSTETVGGTNTSFTTTTNISVVIPSTVPSGTYRMRTVISFSGSGYAYPSLNPCMTSYSYGEARDYKITITDAPPIVTATPTTIAYGGITTGTSSPEQSFSITGAFLLPSSGSLTVTAPTGFTVCSTAGGTYTSSYNVAYTSGTLAATNVFVRFNPTASTTYSGNVQVTGGGIGSAVNVAVSGTGAAVCTGTPTAGTTVISPTTGTVSTAFTLSLSGTTTSGGLTYQWQSSSTGYSGSYTNITGATSPTYMFTGIRSNMYFQCVVTCPTFGSSTSTPVLTTFVLPTPCSTPFTYASTACSAGMAATIQSFYLAGFLGNINDVLACNNTGYRDRTALSTTMVTGSGYTATVATTSVSSYTVNCQIWIDFNGDGTFVSSETVGGANNISGSSNAIGINIPSGVGTGLLRMRALVTYGSGVTYPSLNPCGGYNYGEVRDYSVVITAPTACSGTPAPGPLTATATSGCNPVASTLSMPDIAGITGLTYQWQSSSTGGAGTYSNIIGATGYTYNSSSTANTYYICNVTCSYTTLSANSSSQLITVTPSPGAITGSNVVCVSGTSTLSNSLSGGTWSSSAPSIATIHPTTGFVTGLSGGSCTISYSAGGCSPATTSFIVNTAPGSISGFTSLCVGGNSTLTNSVSGGTWSSADTAIATVVPSTGVTTAVAAGTTTITYSNGCGSPATRSWTTNVSPGAISGPSSVCVATTASYTNSVTGGSWSNSPTTVGTINSSTGLFTATSTTGTTLITYTIGFCSIIETVTVGNTGPGAISGASTVCANATTTLTNGVSGGTWSSSDEAIATVNPTTGVVLGVTSGSATITYSTGCSTDATRNMTVNGSPVTITAPTVCSQGNLNLTANTGAGSYTYSWTGPRSFSSTSRTPVITNAKTINSGIYSVTATQSGCVTSRSFWASVDTTPQGNVYASNDVICATGVSSLTAVVSSPLSGTNNYALFAIPYAPATLTTATTGPSGDNVNATVSMPFSFNYYGVSYSSVNISTNGYINFGTASTSFSTAALPSAMAPLGMIAPFWHNLNAASGSIVYATQGVAPNRKFIVNYNGVGELTGAGVNTGQIVLYETSNVIELFISQANTASTYLGVCGIQDASGANAVTVTGQNNANYNINNAVAGTGWRFARPQYSYVWSPATSLSTTTGATTVSSGLTSTQIFTTSVADANSGCAAGIWVDSIVVAPNPTVAINTSATNICTGGTMMLTASPSGGTGTATYTWSGPGISTTTSSSPTPSAFYPSVGTTTMGRFRVSVAYTGSGCPAAVDSSIIDTVATQPIVSVAPSATTLCLGDTLTLTATTTSGGAGSPTYTWSGAGISTTTGTSAAAAFTPTASTGAYSVAVAYSGSNCNTANANTSAVTVNTGATITLSSSPTACMGTTSVNQGYTATTGGPTHYNITWGSTALSAGFSNVTYVSLPASNIPITVPSGATIGSYTGSLTVTNGTCSSTPVTISINVVGYPTAHIVSANQPCYGYSTNIIFAGTPDAEVYYMIDSASTLHSTLTGSTATDSFVLSTSAMTAPHNYTLVNVVSGACTTAIDTVVYVNPAPMQWVGGTSSDWTDASNWSCGFVPGGYDNVSIVPGSTFAPVIAASSVANVRGLSLNGGASLIINSGATLHVKGNLNLSGNITGTGTLALDTTTAQTITGLGAVNNLILNNTAGATINTGARVTVKSVLTLTNGTLTTNDSLVLYSDSSITARVAPITSGSIAGNVKVMQYIPGGRRAYRFWAHPFSNYIGLAQAQQFIDITGPGGSTNGFTNTGTNAPSAFRYETTESNSSLGYDPGWRRFASTATTVDSNRFKRYQGIRLFIRGDKGEGLGAAAYTPSPTNITQIGQLNQGRQLVSLQKGGAANQDYNMLGNPYASPVDLGTIMYNAKVSGNIVGAAYYIWNPYLATVGQFQAIPVNTTSATPYYIQANAAFQVRAANNGDSLVFNESNKSATVTTSILKLTNEQINLHIYDENYHLWDMVRLSFAPNATDGEDNDYDAVKPFGPEFNFYSIAANQKALAIDGRPLDINRAIPLGIKSNYKQRFIVKAAAINTPDGSQVYLNDKWLQKQVLLQAGTEYSFDVTKEASSQGDQRFELVMKPGQNQANAFGLKVDLSPNPTTADVQLSYVSTTEAPITVSVTDVTGVVVYTHEYTKSKVGTLVLPTAQYAAGIYMVTFTSGTNKVVRQLVKQ